jgi:hypothetical protein
MEDIVLIAMTIVGNILGILILNNVNVSKRILLIIGMDIFLYLFHFPIVCSSIVLAQILFQIAIETRKRLSRGLFLF